jgi:peptidyl-tRNA hydrolase
MNQFFKLLLVSIAFATAFSGAMLQNGYIASVGIFAMVGLAVAGVVIEWLKWQRLKREKIKMYCICSKEALDKMKGIRGKMITQGGHAYLHAFWDAERRFPDLAVAYRRTEHAYKITLVVPTENDLKVLMESYRDICGVSLVEDAGMTVFKNEDGSPRPTITYLGLGPITESMIKDDLAPNTGPKTLT